MVSISNPLLNLDMSDSNFHGMDAEDFDDMSAMDYSGMHDGWKFRKVWKVKQNYNTTLEPFYKHHAEQYLHHAQPMPAF